MTVLEHIEAGTPLPDLQNMAYGLCVDTDAQRLALRLIQLHSVAHSLCISDLNDLVETARLYVQSLNNVRIVKRNLSLVDKATAGVEIPLDEQYVYERTSDMVQFFKWFGNLCHGDVYLLINCVAEATTMVSGYTDILKAINAALAEKAKKPMDLQLRELCHRWLCINWAAPERSTFRLEWPRKALNSLFGY